MLAHRADAGLLGALVELDVAISERRVDVVVLVGDGAYGRGVGLARGGRDAGGAEHEREGQR